MLNSRSPMCFSAFHAGAPEHRPWSPRAWTLLGAIAIPLWATWPALSLETRGIPKFECLAIAFLVAWAVSSGLERTVPVESRQPAWRRWIPAAAFGLAEVGSAAFFLLATRRIPAAEANLIVYLWPGIVVCLGALLKMFRFTTHHVAGLLLGFGGAAVLIGGGTLSASFIGIALALAAGLSWALYCVLRLKWTGATGPLLARGFAIAAALCVVLHLMLETFSLPTAGSAAAAAAIGIVPSAVANVAWDEGFRKGDGQLLAVMAYATPLCSTLLLIALGLEFFTWRLLIGAVAIVTAGFLSRTAASDAAS